MWLRPDPRQQFPFYRSTGMRVFFVAALIALLAGTTALAAPARTKGIYGGVVTVGRGAAGVTRGMTRAQVIARLGRPLREHGYMAYENEPQGKINSQTPHGMFDIYLKNNRVRMIAISPHSGWRLPDGTRIFATGAITRLMRRYGHGLRATGVEDGERAYRITERYLGRTVWTEFYVERFGSSASVYGFDVLFPLSA
jgi:hypothetical protein